MVSAGLLAFAHFLTMPLHRSQSGGKLAKLVDKHFPRLSDLTIKDRGRGYAKLMSSFSSVMKDHRQKVRDNVAAELELTVVAGVWGVNNDEDDRIFGWSEDFEDDVDVSEDEASLMSGEYEDSLILEEDGDSLTSDENEDLSMLQE